MPTRTSPEGMAPPSTADRPTAPWGSLDPVAVSLYLSQVSTSLDLDGYAAVMWLNAGHLPASLPIAPPP